MSTTKQELLVKDAADKARSAKKAKTAGKGKKRAALSDDDDDFEIKPKKKAAPIKKAKPAVALPATDDENDAPAPVKVSFSLARILTSARPPGSEIRTLTAHRPTGQGCSLCCQIGAESQSACEAQT